jgi:hypothetical protein
LLKSPPKSKIHGPRDEDGCRRAFFRATCFFGVFCGIASVDSGAAGAANACALDTKGGGCSSDRTPGVEKDAAGGSVAVADAGLSAAAPSGFFAIVGPINQWKATARTT